MEYAIIKNASLTNLAKNVNMKINDGWLPLGGITVVQGTERWDEYFIERVHEGSPKVETTFIQAITRVVITKEDKKYIKDLT